MLIVSGLTGLTLIIVRGVIFHSFRDWLLLKRPNDAGYLFTCCQCMGFWIGLLGSVPFCGVGLSAVLYAGAVSLSATLADKWMIKQLSA
jgi:hypothetical protein